MTRDRAVWVHHARHLDQERRSAGASRFGPSLVFGHFLLAAAGLVVWIAYLVTGTAALAWVAFADLVVIAGLGGVMVVRWWKTRRGELAAVGGGGGATAATAAAELRFPSSVVGLHGVVAVATLVLVLLVALGVGS